MEHLSSFQLKKYQHILNEIDSGFKQQEILKNELDNECNRLTALRITMEEDFLQKNVFKVLVKIFDSIFDIHYLYGDHIEKTELECLRMCPFGKLYLVEIHVSKIFKQNFGESWFNVSIRDHQSHVCKSVPVEGDRVLVIIPFAGSTKATVTTSLLMKFDKFYSALRVSTTKVDISYHFCGNFTLPDLIVDMVPQKLQMPQLEYSFNCRCTAKHFFEAVVQNCFHRLKPQLMPSFGNDSICLNFVFDYNACLIKLDNNEIMKIVCNPKDMCEIKKYFARGLKCHKIVLNKIWLTSVMNLKQYLRNELSQKEVNVNNLKVIYEELRKLIFDLPV